MIAAIRRMFRKQTPLEVAILERAEAQMSNLAVQTAQDYSIAMGSYHDARIERLNAFIAAQSRESANG